MRLDRSQPFGQVFGIPGVAWEQNGQYFRHDGSPLSEPEKPTAPKPRKTSKELAALRAMYGDEVAELHALRDGAPEQPDRLAPFRGNGKRVEPAWVDGA